jgi:pectin methylesterase-like acyl-CoA thioesterase
MRVKIFFISFILLAFSVFAQSQTSTSAEETKLKATKHGTPVASFKGTGNQTTKSFQLKSGKATFEAELNWEKLDSELAPGEGKFAIVLQNEQGKTVEDVIATFDHFDGARTVNIAKDGKYQLKITAPGPWSVSIHQ